MSTRFLRGCLGRKRRRRRRKKRLAAESQRAQRKASRRTERQRNEKRSDHSERFCFASSESGWCEFSCGGGKMGEVYRRRPAVVSKFLTLRPRVGHSALRKCPRGFCRLR